jgi:regulator of sirC expression with transglutaminase-like and TPR domain
MLSIHKDFVKRDPSYPAVFTSTQAVGYAPGMLRLLLTLSSLYATLDPLSVSQHFAFYELYPKTSEGKQALRHAWYLLSKDSSNVDPEMVLPSIDLQPILSLVNRAPDMGSSLLDPDSLAVIDKLSHRLANRNLPGHNVWTLEETLKLQPAELDLSRGLLIAELGEEKEKIRGYEAHLDLMALQILARLPENATHVEKLRAISDYIFSEMRFRFPPQSLYAKEIDVYTFLPAVLESRRGVCLGVSILYLCLAQRLELPLEAITPPGHIYVRYVNADGVETNIETTARGIDVPSDYYLGIETKELQKRSVKEVIGLAFINQAAITWHKKDYAGAVELYEKARLFLQGDSLCQLFLGLNYVFMGKEVEGKRLLKEIQGKVPDFLASLYTVAEDYIAGHCDVEAMQAVFAEVDDRRSSILDKQKQLQKISEKFPKFRQALFHVAVTHLQLGREKEALPWLERFVAISPQDATAHYYLAAIQHQRRDFAKAWKSLHAAETIAFNKGHSPRALKELRRSLEQLCPEKRSIS